MNLTFKTLYIVSTPIGNLDDITLRAIDVIKKSDFILCEDTRRSLKLLNHLKIKKRLVSYHKFNEKKQIRNIIEHINKGKILSLISDAGTPLLSDPGDVILGECLKKNIKVVPIPGVSSITTAMSMSGFKDQFLFYGFLPKKERELDNKLETLSLIEFAQVFFIPSVKINFYLKKFEEFYKGRRIVIAREMTKIHETFHRGDVNSIRGQQIPSKGEVTIILSEKKMTYTKINKEKIVNKAKKYLKRYSLKDAVNLILETEKINRKEIYQLCLKIKNEKDF